MLDTNFSRRDLLRHGSVVAAAATMPALATPAADRDKPSLQALAEDAAIWGLPLVSTGRYKALSDARGVHYNRFYLNQTLATPSLKVAGPNVDTIYGFAWLDLAKGPIVLDVPEAGDRYYSIQFMDAYQNVFAYVGKRATGTGAGTYVIAGPNAHGALPKGAKRIDSPTALVFVLTRTLVRGARDLPAAQALQATYTLAPLSSYPAGRQAGIVEADALNILPALNFAGDAGAYFAELDRLVRQYPPRGQEVEAFRKLAPLGLGSHAPRWKTLPQAQLQAALDHALARIKAENLGDKANGWRVNYHIRPFNADPLVRAAVNLVGPGAHVAEEALYFFAPSDSQGAPLTGAHSYSITFAKGQLPPVHAFWSLILYGADFFLVDNPINRYAINDRSDGLVYEPNGDLKIVIQHAPPTQKDVNWLPAPAGLFRLILRTYQPDETVLSGAYKPPAVARIA